VLLKIKNSHDENDKNDDSNNDGNNIHVWKLEFVLFLLVARTAASSVARTAASAATSSLKFRVRVLVMFLMIVLFFCWLLLFLQPLSSCKIVNRDYVDHDDNIYLIFF
jgi:hypothetical protein